MKRRKLLGLIGVLALAAGGASIAWAATGSDSETIQACVAKNGKVSIYGPGIECPTYEHPLTWAVQGPPGPQGPAGKDGDGTGTDETRADGSVTFTTGHSGSGGPLELEAYSHEIVSPRDSASGLPTGKRQHKPLTITKEIDKATPLLMRSIYTNDTLPAVQITLDNADGTAVAIAKLTNAQVSDHLQQGSQETVSFTYQKIEWTWIDGGITASDDWNPATG